MEGLLKNPTEEVDKKSTRGLPPALFLPKSKHDRRIANAAQAYERAGAKVRKTAASAGEVAEAARRKLQDAFDDEYLKTGVDPEAKSTRRADRAPEYVVASRSLERAYRDALEARDRAVENASFDSEVMAAVDRHRQVNLEYEVWVSEVCLILKCRPGDIDWKAGTFQPIQEDENTMEVPLELLEVLE